jgi:hypothetical protein
VFVSVVAAKLTVLVAKMYGRPTGNPGKRKELSSPGRSGVRGRSRLSKKDLRYHRRHGWDPLCAEGPHNVGHSSAIELDPGPFGEVRLDADLPELLTEVQHALHDKDQGVG